jgi:hypothetical protein
LLLGFLFDRRRKSGRGRRGCSMKGNVIIHAGEAFIGRKRGRDRCGRRSSGAKRIERLCRYVIFFLVLVLDRPPIKNLK